MEAWVRRFRPGILVAALALLAGACGAGAGETKSASSPRQVSILISFQDGPIFYPYAVARKMGYLEQEGLAVKVQATKGSSFVTQQILSGNARWGMANGPADIIAYSKDPAIRVPSCFQNRLIYQIGVLKGSPVHTVADLKGKVLGTTEAGSGEYPFAYAALRDAGLVPNKDVKLFPIGDGTPATRQALSSHEVDAYISESSVFHTLSDTGMAFDYVPLGRDYARSPQSCFVTTSSALRDPAQRKVVVGIARAFAKGIEFGIANPEAAAQIVCADLPQTCQDRDVALQEVKDATVLATPLDASVRSGGIDSRGWQAAATVALVAGQVSKPVDASTIIDSPEVRAARAEILNFDPEPIRQAAREYRS
jgi:NitT/TauT family transport system substrate-binding protein